MFFIQYILILSSSKKPGVLWVSGSAGKGQSISALRREACTGQGPRSPPATMAAPMPVAGVAVAMAVAGGSRQRVGGGSSGRDGRDMGPVCQAGLRSSDECFERKNSCPRYYSSAEQPLSDDSP